MNKFDKSQADIPTMTSPDLDPTSTRDSSLESLRNLGRCMLDRYKVDARGERPETTLVFVLGAEASRASCLQGWKSFGRSLVDDLSGHYVHDEKDAFLDDALTRLQPLIGPASGNSLKEKKDFLKEKASPEQIFEVACRNTIFEEKVRSKLADAYGPGRAPQLGYELVAHFLRHRFIDHVVNFNWDEILDRAIADELGPSGYERVLPGDRTSSSAESREQPPRHFKLHGTASSPGSLRFTTAETGLLSLTTMEQLDEALFDIRTSDDGPAPRKCHLVSFGYSWSDPDFVNYVVARWELFERLTVVRLGEDYPSEVKRLLEQAQSKDYWKSDRGCGKIAVVSADQLADAASGGTPLVDHVLWSLWELFYRDAREGAPWLRLTPAARHILLGLYFAPVRSTYILPLVRQDSRGESKGGKKEEKGDYCHRPDPGPLFEYDEPRRLRIEFLLHVMKSKGMINLSPMGRDPRIAGALERASGARPLYDLLDNPNVFEPSPGSAIRETYFLLPAPQDQGVLAPTSSILTAAADTVAKALGVYSMTNPTFKPVWTKNTGLTFQTIEFGLLFHECALQIFEADDVEVTAARDSRNNVLFIAPRALTSWARLSGESSTLLAQPWDVLLVIAESGRWIFNALAELELLSDGAKPVERQIFLVRTSDRDLERWQIGKAYDVDIEQRIEELNSKGILTRSVAIPWWRHNRHMTLTLNSTDESKGERYQLGKGIYFRRRLKDHRIAPVLVDHRKPTDRKPTVISDRFELLLLFLSYTSRAADSYRNSAANRLAGSDETRKDFEDLKGFAHQLIQVVSSVECTDERYCASRARLCEEIKKKIELLRQDLALG
ncbi:MAG: hypothetical protein ACJ76N_00675 [Thermoanaerobaculia bacterium]